MDKAKESDLSGSETLQDIGMRGLQKDAIESLEVTRPRGNWKRRGGSQQAGEGGLRTTMALRGVRGGEHGLKVIVEVDWGKEWKKRVERRRMREEGGRVRGQKTERRGRRGGERQTGRHLDGGLYSVTVTLQLAN